MYAIMGVTGQVGGAAARTLLAKEQGVRAIVRDPAKGAAWAALGADIAVADWQDAAALQTAFTGTEGVFVMLPANFALDPDFTEPRAIIAALHQAVAAAHPPKIVCLSSVGAHQTSGLGLITQLHLLESGFGDLRIPTAFVRPAWFLENTRWDIPIARQSGEIPSFLYPLDRAIPMVATADIGRVIAETLTQTWAGRRVIELEGPRRYSPNDLAAVLETLLGRSVRAVDVPRSQWAEIFGEPSALRIEMLDGFNSGWIDFEGHGTEHLFGKVTLEEALEYS